MLATFEVWHDHTNHLAQQCKKFRVKCLLRVTTRLLSPFVPFPRGGRADRAGRCSYAGPCWKWKSCREKLKAGSRNGSPEARRQPRSPQSGSQAPASPRATRPSPSPCPSWLLWGELLSSHTSTGSGATPPRQKLKNGATVTLPSLGAANVGHLVTEA